MTVRDFTRLCAEHGFARTAPYIYARCFGDGVLQTIDISRLLSVSLDSPGRISGKSRYISIGISSMYANWPESCFTPELYAWQYYSPDSFLGRNPSTEPFRGFDAHCAIMEECGFAYLDRISDQKTLLDAKLELERPRCGGRGKWLHASWVYAPLAVCERWDEAMHEVCRYYTHSWETFHANNDHLMMAGQHDVYCRKEQELMQELAETRQVWRYLLINDYISLGHLLRNNYERNMRYAQVHGIPIVK